MNDIFLSYSSQDRLRVLPLVHALERHGWSVWWDRQIRPGKTFDQVIEDALQRARCVVVVWSKASVQSDWVRAEAEAAKVRRILIPVRIDHQVPLPLSFSLIQAASLWDWQGAPSHPEFKQFILAITDLIGPPRRAPVFGDNPVKLPLGRQVEGRAMSRRKLEDAQKPDKDHKRCPAWIDRHQMVSTARVALSQAWQQPLLLMVGVMLCVLILLSYFTLLQYSLPNSIAVLQPQETTWQSGFESTLPRRQVTLWMKVVNGEAEVYRDGQRVGTTPYPFIGQSGERAEFTFKLDGYYDLTKSMEILKKIIPTICTWSGYEGNELGHSPPMDVEPYDVEMYMHTDVGCQRLVNEDCICGTRPGDPEVLAHKGILAIVADGVGGHKGGDVASNSAVEVVRQVYYQDPGAPCTALQNAFITANQMIHEAAQHDVALQGMGTTCTALVLWQNTALVAHVGDSRLYLLRQGELFLMTEDHTVVQQMVKAGLLTAHDARVHSAKHVIVRALGSRPTVEVSMWQQALPIQEGDLFMLCSDGLYDLVEDAEMQQILLSAQARDAGEQLIALARERGGYDNITVGLVRVNSVHPCPAPNLLDTRGVRDDASEQYSTVFP